MAEFNFPWDTERTLDQMNLVARRAVVIISDDHGFAPNPWRSVRDEFERLFPALSMCTWIPELNFRRTMRFPAFLAMAFAGIAPRYGPWQIEHTAPSSRSHPLTPSTLSEPVEKTP